MLHQSSAECLTKLIYLFHLLSLFFFFFFFSSLFIFLISLDLFLPVCLPLTLVSIVIFCIFRFVKEAGKKAHIRCSKRFNIKYSFLVLYKVHSTLAHLFTKGQCYCRVLRSDQVRSGSQVSFFWMVGWVEKKTRVSRSISSPARPLNILVF